MNFSVHIKIIQHRNDWLALHLEVFFFFFFFFSFEEFFKSFFRFKRYGVIAESSQVKENDSNDSDFPLKLMEKTTNGMDIG